MASLAGIYDALIVQVFLTGGILGHLIMKWFIQEWRRSRG